MSSEYTVEIGNTNTTVHVMTSDDEDVLAYSSLKDKKDKDVPIIAGIVISFHFSSEDSAAHTIKFFVDNVEKQTFDLEKNKEGHILTII